MTILTIYPVWTLMDNDLVVAFIVMSVLSIVYLIFSLVAFWKRYFKTYRKLLVDGISGLYLTGMALLSAYCCLYAVDPTNRLFCFMTLVAFMLALLHIFLARVSREPFQNTLKTTMQLKVCALVYFTLVIALSRIAVFVFDSDISYAIYFVVNVLCVAWLALGYYGFSGYRKAELTAFEEEFSEE